MSQSFGQRLQQSATLESNAAQARKELLRSDAVRWTSSVLRQYEHSIMAGHGVLPEVNTLTGWNPKFLTLGRISLTAEQVVVSFVEEGWILSWVSMKVFAA